MPQRILPKRRFISLLSKKRSDPRGLPPSLHATIRPNNNPLNSTGSLKNSEGEEDEQANMKTNTFFLTAKQNIYDQLLKKKAEEDA